MTGAATPRMRAQSPRRVCSGCSTQIKGKIRLQRCEGCYRSHLRGRRSAGEPPTKPPTGNSTGEIALASVEHDPTGCWLYTGPLDREGYGRGIQLKGHPRTRVHRAVYLHLVGPIPDGMQLDHTCHDPQTCAGGVQCQHRRCVNPEHLKPTTGRNNTLRSNAITAINARKTHCKRGHEFTPDNTQIVTRSDGRTYRKCIACHHAVARPKA